MLILLNLLNAVLLYHWILNAVFFNIHFWDLIIYGKVGPDEFCTFPLYDIVKQKYNKNKIAFIFGGDEIFNLKITDKTSYHINMFNCYIYYISMC